MPGVPDLPFLRRAPVRDLAETDREFAENDNGPVQMIAKVWLRGNWLSCPALLCLHACTARRNDKTDKKENHG